MLLSLYLAPTPFSTQPQVPKAFIKCSKVSNSIPRWLSQRWYFIIACVLIQMGVHLMAKNIRRKRVHTVFWAFLIDDESGIQLLVSNYEYYSSKRRKQIRFCNQSLSLRRSSIVAVFLITLSQVLPQSILQVSKQSIHFSSFFFVFFFLLLFLFFQALDTKTTQLNQKQISVLVLHLIFYRLTVD